MKKEYKEADIKKADNIEKCKIIKAIIKRTSNFYKGGITYGKYNKRNKKR